MLRIALLYGGTSTEREVSLSSGRAVEAALRRIGHDVIPLDVARDSLAPLTPTNFDFAFIALHGGEGENGSIQRRLDEAGLAYSGSGPIASRLAMDKELSKAEFLTNRVPTPPYEVAEAFDAEYRLRRMSRRIGWPIVVKPVDQGSSIGVTIVHRPEDAPRALREAFSYSNRSLLEKGVPGRELTVGILGGRALPVCEVIPPEGLYDYRAKYDATAGTRYIVNPDLGGAVAKMAQHYARRAHHALRCHGFSRVDLMLDEHGELWVLEVNTLPGLTETSLLPKAAAHEGTGFDELIQEMIDASLEPRRRAGGTMRRAAVA
jgi:D-alanine-D-alanine ligase